jgi:hypothetical protein
MDLKSLTSFSFFQVIFTEQVRISVKKSNSKTIVGKQHSWNRIRPCKPPPVPPKFENQINHLKFAV